MQFYKISSAGKSMNLFNLSIKLSIILIILFLGFFLIDKIEFPAPSKNIEKISNDKLEVVK